MHGIRSTHTNTMTDITRTSIGQKTYELFLHGLHGSSVLIPGYVINQLDNRKSHNHCVIDTLDKNIKNLLHSALPHATLTFVNHSLYFLSCVTLYAMDE